MIKKYGKKVYSECYPEEARKLFIKSQSVGVGAAAIELAQLDKYRQLEGIKSVHLGE